MSREYGFNFAEIFVSKVSQHFDPIEPDTMKLKTPSSRNFLKLEITRIVSEHHYITSVHTYSYVAAFLKKKSRKIL